MYDPLEIQALNYRNYSNPFDFGEAELNATFISPRGKRFLAIGFYDGDCKGGQIGNIWKLRFMPNETGTWTYVYRWNDGTKRGEGRFSVINRMNEQNHGHVHVDHENPRYLSYDDGTAHYWWGANWIGATAYGPKYIDGILNMDHVSDYVFIDWLNTLEQYGHNGILLKIALFPLKNDKYSWELAWIHRAEWLLKEMQKRGIYAHINFFDTWSREKGNLRVNTDGRKQVFNVWADGDEDVKENYIKTIVARFSGFSNVYWELGNEMEHAPNSGKAFVEQANKKYIPWIKKYDPYGLPIGLSEGIWRETDVDIGFVHQPKDITPVRWNQPKNKLKNIVKKLIKKRQWDRPVIMNELVKGDKDNKLWSDEAIRNSANRFEYRKTFWLVFTKGGSGCSEATGLNFKTPPNQAMLNVMADQKHLRDFMERLPINISEMIPYDDFVISGPANVTTRGKRGSVYISYFYLTSENTKPRGPVKVNLPKGLYRVNWYDPREGTFFLKGNITSTGAQVLIERPEFSEDIAMVIMNLSLI